MDLSYNDYFANSAEFVDSIPGGFCIYNEISRYPFVEFIVWNKYMMEITGYNMEEINKIGMKQLCHFHGNGSNMLINIDDTNSKVLDSNEREIEIITKCGVKKALNVKYNNVISKEGKKSMVAFIKDITERMQLLQELSEIKNRYNKILEFSSDAIFIHGDAKFKYVNENAKKLLNIEKDEDIIGQPILKFIHSDYHEIINVRIKDTQNNGNSAPMIEEKLLTLDGKVRDVEVITTCIPCEGKKCNFVFVRDITDRKRIENELRENESMLRHITENTLDMISTCTLDYTFNYATPSHKNILGYNHGELIGRKVTEIVHPDEAECIKRELDRMKETRQQSKVQCRCRCKDGSYKHIEICGKVLYNNNICEGFIFSSRNTSERVEAEKALKISEKRFRELFNNVNDAIYLNKLGENGLPSVYIEVNDRACQRLGYTREELCNMTIYGTNPTLNDERVKGVLKTIGERGNVIYETLARTKEGNIMPVEINSILMVLNDEEYILSISRDITERKKNEKTLRESEEKYRRLIEAFPYAVYIKTKDKIVFSNKVGLEYLGLTHMEELIGKDCSKIFRPHPLFENNFNKNNEYITANGFMPLTEEKVIRCTDNKVLDLETIVTSFPYNERDDSYLIVSRDIRDRKKAEALEMEMEEKSRQFQQAAEYERLRTEFFANISHELRTPINVILSTLQLINLNINRAGEDFVHSIKYERHIWTMKQNCYRLIRLINNLIDVTKIDAGYLNLELTNTNIVAVIEDITLSVAEYIENKGISLVFDTDVEEKIMACDPDKIERIVLNLISNAVKFTEPGGSVFVSIMDKDRSILISVKDTGIGISKDKQKLIFERFVQVDKSLTRNREGSGIGLSLVKSLVEMHGGTIRVESEPYTGSEFIIELPVYIMDKEEVNTNKYLIQGKVEKIDIEFSDIYF